MSGKQKQPTPLERLVAAMDRCARARAEAQWTNGYRAHREAMISVGDGEAYRLQSKEIHQWTLVEKADMAFKRLARRLLREAGKPKRR